MPAIHLQLKQQNSNMRAAERGKARMAELEQTCQHIEDSSNKYLAKLDHSLNANLAVIGEFHNSFEMQLNTIDETQRLYNLRAEKLESAYQEVQFWNHLKQGIIERQRRENMEIARVAENAFQAHESARETEKAMQAELDKQRQVEGQRRGKFKNVTNNLVQQSETAFNTASRSIKISMERNKEAISLELRFAPERLKYVVAGECHPKVNALVGQFNFHKDVQRLRRELSQLLTAL